MPTKIKKGDHVVYKAEWKSPHDPEYFTAISDESDRGAVDIQDTFSTLFLKPWHIASVNMLDVVR
jgi:hypothetical protein